jgi:hypothetical protein
MFKNNIGKSIIRILFSLIVIWIFLWNVHGSAIEDTCVVAVVAGREILYKEIKADPEIVQLSYDKPLQLNELEKAIYDYENQRLAMRIKLLIEEDMIRKLGIAVTDEEVDRELKRRFEQAEISQRTVDEIRKKSIALAKALEEWQQNPEKSDVIYQERLASKSITSQQWKVFQLSYNTPEKLAEMRGLIPSTVADMIANSRSSCRQDLLFEKLNVRIASAVSVEEWWQEQYRQAKIEIKDERFKDVLEMLIPSTEEKEK